MSTDGQGTKWHRNIAKDFNRLSRMHERYRQIDRRTDGQQHIANVNVSSRSGMSCYNVGECGLFSSLFSFQNSHIISTACLGFYSKQRYILKGALHVLTFLFKGLDVLHDTGLFWT